MSLCVQFGCGGPDTCLPGWDNHDLDMDIRKPLKYETDTVDGIQAEHVVEHVTHEEALTFLTECYRILRPNGILRVCVPVLENLARREHAVSIIRDWGHKAAYSRELLMSLLWVAGFSKDNIVISYRKPVDSHWKSIGLELDDLETARIEARK